MQNFWTNFTDFEPETEKLILSNAKLKNLNKKFEYFHAGPQLVSWKSKFNAKNL